MSTIVCDANPRYLELRPTISGIIRDLECVDMALVETGAPAHLKSPFRVSAKILERLLMVNGSNEVVFADDRIPVEEFLNDTPWLSSTPSLYRAADEAGLYLSRVPDYEALPETLGALSRVKYSKTSDTAPNAEYDAVELNYRTSVLDNTRHKNVFQ